MAATDRPSALASPHPGRQIALEPYIRKIRSEVMRAAGRGRGEGSLRLRIGSRTLALESWVLDALVEVSVAPDEGSPTGLLVQTVAFSAKCLHDMETLGKTERRDIHRVHALEAELVLDVALGTALLRELKNRVDTVARSGKVDLGKDWNRLRQTVEEIVAASRESLGEAEAKHAEELSWDFSGQAKSSLASDAARITPHRPILAHRPVAAAGSAASVSEHRPKRPARELAPEGVEEIEDAPPHSSLSLAIAAVIAITGVAMLLWSRQTTAGPARAVALDQLPAAARIVSFEAHPLSASITIREEAWRELDGRAKLGWINDLGRALARGGHKGFVVRSTAGRPLAQWLAARGAVILEARDVAAETPENRPATPRARLH